MSKKSAIIPGRPTGAVAPRPVKHAKKHGSKTVTASSHSRAVAALSKRPEKAKPDTGKY